MSEADYTHIIQLYYVTVSAIEVLWNGSIAQRVVYSR